MTLNPNLDSGWIGRKGESICARLRDAAERLIPSHGDPHIVSRAFGYGKTEQDSRVQAGVICQNLANQIQEDLDNGR